MNGFPYGYVSKWGAFFVMNITLFFQEKSIAKRTPHFETYPYWIVWFGFNNIIASCASGQWVCMEGYQWSPSWAWEMRYLTLIWFDYFWLYTFRFYWFETVCIEITYSAFNPPFDFWPQAAATTGAQALASKAFDHLDQDPAGRDQAPAGGEWGGNREGLNEQSWKEFSAGAS